TEVFLVAPGLLPELEMFRQEDQALPKRDARRVDRRIEEPEVAEDAAPDHHPIDPGAGDLVQAIPVADDVALADDQGVLAEPIAYGDEPGDLVPAGGELGILTGDATVNRQRGQVLPEQRLGPLFGDPAIRAAAGLDGDRQVAGARPGRRDDLDRAIRVL